MTRQTLKTSELSLSNILCLKRATLFDTEAIIVELEIYLVQRAKAAREEGMRLERSRNTVHEGMLQQELTEIKQAISKLLEFGGS